MTDLETTGRFLVVVDDGQPMGAAVAAWAPTAGIRAVSAEEARDGVGREDGLAVVFEQLGIAVVDAEPDRLAHAVADEDTPSPSILEPERYVYAVESVEPGLEPPSSGRWSPDYLAGYRDAVLHLTGPEPAGSALPVAGPAMPDESRLTWGLQAVGAASSTRTGKGVRVAVLDTGVDRGHPDLAERIAGAESFIAGEAVQDTNGHGTHCIGTVAGPAAPAGAPRYGVAPGVRLYAGKVLGGPQGRGTDTSILSGIEWALRNRCKVVSMSLGAPVQPGTPYSRAFETAARRAVRQGTLIVAAAGNDSDRPRVVRPVSHPANCPSIVAVAALDWRLAIARFSNRGLNPSGGQVDFAGPGVDVLSCGIGNQRYRRLSGTSMATPHAAGVAALVAEANPDASAIAISGFLSRGAKRLPLASVDVGAGLVQAP